MPSRTGLRGELVFSLEICANEQDYYRVGGDGSGDRKEEMFLIKKQFGILLLILLRKSAVAGAGARILPRHILRSRVMGRRKHRVK